MEVGTAPLLCGSHLCLGRNHDLGRQGRSLPLWFHWSHADVEQGGLLRTGAEAGIWLMHVDSSIYFHWVAFLSPLKGWCGMTCPRKSSQRLPPKKPPHTAVHVAENNLVHYAELHSWAYVVSNGDFIGNVPLYLPLCDDESALYREADCLLFFPHIGKWLNLKLLKMWSGLSFSLSSSHCLKKTKVRIGISFSSIWIFGYIIIIYLK